MKKKLLLVKGIQNMLFGNFIYHFTYIYGIICWQKVSNCAPWHKGGYATAYHVDYIILVVIGFMSKIFVNFNITYIKISTSLRCFINLAMLLH